MTDQPTPTPRTDLHSVHWVQQGGSQSTEVVPAYFARELERELRFNEKVSKQIWSVNERLKRQLDEAREQLAAERALADRLANALTECLCGYTYDSDRSLAAWKEARRG